MIGRITILAVILIGIAIFLGIYLPKEREAPANISTTTHTVRCGSWLIYYGGKGMDIISFNVDSIRDRQVFLTQIETQDKIVFKEQDIFCIIADILEKK